MSTHNDDKSLTASNNFQQAMIDFLSDKDDAVLLQAMIDFEKAEKAKAQIEMNLKRARARQRTRGDTVTSGGDIKRLKKS